MGVSGYESSPITERETRRPEKVQGGFRNKTSFPREGAGWEVGRLQTKKNASPGEGAGWKVEYVHTRRPEKTGWEVSL